MGYFIIFISVYGFILCLFLFSFLFCFCSFRSPFLANELFSVFTYIFRLIFISFLLNQPTKKKTKQFRFFSCPAGFKMSGTQCINENECLWRPCQNGGICTDLQPPRKYECDCPFGYTGMNCELELLASGVLTPSRDFIIAIIICASTLICK